MLQHEFNLKHYAKGNKSGSKGYFVFHLYEVPRLLKFIDRK